ncbi:MAG TPA: phosphatase PAP2 family protein [Nitrososphaeraceae archaeon]
MIHIRSFQFIAIVLAFIVLSVLVHFHLLSSMDSFIFNAISVFNPDQSLLYTFVVISSFGEVVNLILVAIILTIIRRTRKVGMILLITIMTLAILISYMKPLIAQLNPPETQRIPNLPKGFQLESDSLLTEARSFSYPSNHTAVITSLAYIVGIIVQLKSKKYGQVLWILPPMLMLSNLLLGLNYLSDLFGGLLLGLVISITLSTILKLEIPFTINKLKNTR